ncbi:MAG TPA: thioredoxin domain-containing protein [Patescibacteria group bacterium]
MNKKILISFGLFFIFVIIFGLFLRVKYLEKKRADFAILPANTLHTPSGNLSLISKSDYLLGNPNAKVTLIEYSDFECPSCQIMHPIIQKIITEYKDSIRYTSRMFPLPQNKNAQKEAEAALCAGEIGGNKLFWKYSDEIFAKTKGGDGGVGFALDKLVPLAKDLNLPKDAFAKCLDSGKMQNKVLEEKESGEVAGIDSLPAIFITDSKNHTTLLTGIQSIQTLQIVLKYSISP